MIAFNIHTFSFVWIVYRANDAGFLYVAHEVDSSITLPPDVNNWKVVGHCSSECTKSKFPKDGIKFFNVLLHSHLSGEDLVMID